MRPRTGSGDRPMRRSASRKFRLRTRSQVTNPLAVVSDGNGRATDHPSDASLGPSPAIISTVTYAHVVHVLAIYRLPRELRLSESQGKYVSFTEESRDAGRARAWCTVRALAMWSKFRGRNSYARPGGSFPSSSSLVLTRAHCVSESSLVLPF